MSCRSPWGNEVSVLVFFDRFVELLVIVFAVIRLDFFQKIGGSIHSRFARFYIGSTNQTGKIFQIATKYAYQMAIKYTKLLKIPKAMKPTKILHTNALRNAPNLVSWYASIPSGNPDSFTF
jgi:hypothetical protein